MVNVSEEVLNRELTLAKSIKFIMKLILEGSANLNLVFDLIKPLDDL